jgi:ribosome-associated protein
MVKHLTLTKLVEKTVEILDSKKANRISTINLEDLTIITDYFIICNGTSSTHIRTLADEVQEKLDEMGIRPSHVEGYNTARWILLDYGEIVIHIFHEEDRAFYNLERLWSDGIITRFEPEAVQKV